MLPSLGSPLQQLRACPPSCGDPTFETNIMFPGELKWCPKAEEDTRAPSPAAAVGHAKSSDTNPHHITATSQAAGIHH